MSNASAAFRHINELSLHAFVYTNGKRGEEEKCGLPSIHNQWLPQVLSELSLCPGGNCSSALVGFSFSIRYNRSRLSRWESTAKPPALNLKWHEVSSGCGRSHYTTSSYSVNFFSKGPLSDALPAGMICSSRTVCFHTAELCLVRGWLTDPSVRKTGADSSG